MTYKEAELKLDYILKRYYKFAKLWSLNSKRLIKYILWDYKINLKPKIILKFFPIYKLTEIENLALKKFIKENLKKRIYLTITVISRISSIIYTKEKWKIENIYQLQAAK